MNRVCPIHGMYYMNVDKRSVPQDCPTCERLDVMWTKVRIDKLKGAIEDLQSAGQDIDVLQSWCYVVYKPKPESPPLSTG